jgi:hypothetical protein
MTHVPINAFRDKAVRFSDLERNRPIDPKVGVRPMKEPETERHDKTAGDQRKRVKGEIRKGKPRRRNPEDWKEERNPSEGQQENFKRSFLTLRNFDLPAAPAVRGTNEHCDDAGDEDHRFREPGTHGVNQLNTASSVSVPDFTSPRGRHESPPYQQQIAQGILADARQPHEHAGIVHIMIGQVVSLGLSGNQLVALIEVDANYQAIRLG